VQEKEKLFFVFVCAPIARFLFFSYLRARQQRVSSESARKPEHEKLEIGGVRLTSFARLLGVLLLLHVLSGEKMAQRSPRKSLQLNRANTPINFSGPMQDVNVSGSFFI